jgi:hypothetical protein
MEVAQLFYRCSKFGILIISENPKPDINHHVIYRKSFDHRDSSGFFGIKSLVMKHIALFAALVLFSTKSFSQMINYDRGIFGHVYSGTTYMNFNGLRTYLNNPEALENVNIPYTLYTDVGGEWMVVSDRWMFGSGFYSMTVPPINIDSIDFDVNGWGGYIKIGYHYLQTTNAFAYSFLGFGAGVSSLTITNFSGADENVTGYKLSPNTGLNFADGLYFFDAGTGYKLVFTAEGSKNIGGVTVGIDGGCRLYISNSAKPYEQNVTAEERRVHSTTIEDKISRTVFVPYVQMTIGFAGFKTLQSPTK